MNPNEIGALADGDLAPVDKTNGLGRPLGDGANSRCKIDGGDAFDGGAGAAACTIEVGSELALLEPAALEPVTVTRIVEPTSAEVSV